MQTKYALIRASAGLLFKHLFTCSLIQFVYKKNSRKWEEPRIVTYKNRQEGGCSNRGTICRCRSANWVLFFRFCFIFRMQTSLYHFGNWAQRSEISIEGPKGRDPRPRITMSRKFIRALRHRRIIFSFGRTKTFRRSVVKCNPRPIVR